MRHRLASVTAILVFAWLSGCAAPDPKPIDLSSQKLLNPQSAMLLPGGNYRLVTVRQPSSSGILCSEPSPDWAVAFGHAIGGSASGGVPGKASISLSGNSSSTETVTAMLGRTAGVVALRDGLYSACQAYANGVIGKDAYSLILSQYGNLLVSLASGGGGEAPKTSTPVSPPPGVAVTVSTGAPPAAAKPATAGGGAGQGGNAQVAELQQQAVQAMLVACITEYDPTVDHGAGNPLLHDNCDGVMKTFGSALGRLLEPAWISQTAVGTKTIVRRPAIGPQPRVAQGSEAAVRKTVSSQPASP